MKLVICIFIVPVGRMEMVVGASSQRSNPLCSILTVVVPVKLRY